jgi:hypothetical protein
LNSSMAVTPDRLRRGGDGSHRVTTNPTNRTNEAREPRRHEGHQEVAVGQKVSRRFSLVLFVTSWFQIYAVWRCIDRLQGAWPALPFLCFREGPLLGISRRKPLAQNWLEVGNRASHALPLGNFGKRREAVGVTLPSPSWPLEMASRLAVQPRFHRAAAGGA